jgi:hypothetical protein
MYYLILLHVMQCFKINHPQLKKRYDKKKELFDLEMGRNTNVYEVFHGTPNARKIAKQGFNPNLCHSKNRFGRGFYFAPESSKANSYAYGVKKGCPVHNDLACTIGALGKCLSVNLLWEILSMPKKWVLLHQDTTAL